MSSRVCILFLSTFLFLFSLNPANGHAEPWQARFNIRVLSPDVKEIRDTGKIYRSGFSVRIEQLGSNEIFIYDFEHAVEFRIFPDDHLYFEKALTRSKLIRAIKEKWIPSTQGYQETKVLFQKDEINGIPANLFFVTLEKNGQRAYLFRWVTADTHATPLRVIYHGSARETVIVDFIPLNEGPLPPGFFNPPEDYLSLNPF